MATRIVLAAKDQTDFLIKALNQGGVSFFIPKPIDPALVREIIKKAVIRSEHRREQMHEQLLLKGLLDNLPYGLAFMDEQGRFTKMNRLAAMRRGLDVEACLGRTEAEVEPSFTPKELSGFNQRLQKEGRFVEILETPVNEAQQRSQWFMITRLLLDRAKGELKRPSVLMELDITQQKELEAQLRQAEKLQALGTMAGGIAHDFNNLLTAMIGSLELSQQFLTGEEISTKQMGMLKRLQGNALNAAQKGALLTERLLSFSRRKKMALQKVNIFQQLTSSHDLFQQTVKMRFSSRKQEIEAKTEKAKAERLDKTVNFAVENRLSQEMQDICVKTDPAQLEMAILNLCINSVDAMPAGGAIQLMVDKVEIFVDSHEHKQLAPGLYGVITVRDNGSGMSLDTINHIFEPFFTTKEVGWGTGLGMAMVYGFAQQSGGNIMVNSQLGKGTDISIYLPVCREDK